MRLFYRNSIAQQIKKNFCQQSDEFDAIKQNPFYKKYADKITTLQQTSPEKFLSRIEKSRKEKVQKVESYESGVKEVKQSNKAEAFNISYSKPKTLNDVMKIDLLKDHSADEISKIWQEYHRSRKGISAIIPDVNYEKIHLTSLKFPMFLYPVPREQGYEFVVSQFLNHECHFTLLINFQTYKENAPECLRITYYPELQKEKGIVLMHGEFDDQMLNAQESQYLANQLQLYYGGKSERKKNLLQIFNKNPENFNHMDLIRELDLIET